jgi:hypothetical protein
LIEIGVIVNRSEEERFDDGNFRKRIEGALATSRRKNSVFDARTEAKKVPPAVAGGKWR